MEDTCKDLVFPVKRNGKVLKETWKQNEEQSKEKTYVFRIAHNIVLRFVKTETSLGKKII